MECTSKILLFLKIKSGNVLKVAMKHDKVIVNKGCVMTQLDLRLVFIISL